MGRPRVDELLRGAMHVVRRVLPPEAPWPAELVRTADGDTRMLVDAAVLGEWAGWDADPDGHLLGPLDVLRRADGHDVLLPWCTERVGAFLDRRDRSVPLDAGEVVTLAVSLLRAADEERSRVDADGCWWLTDAGRPVFVHGDGDPFGDATADLLDRLGDGRGAPVATAVRGAAELVREPRALEREASEAETALFAAAEAQPLAIAAFSSPRRDAREMPDDADDDAPRATPWWAGWATHVDADLADTFSRAATAVWRRFQAPRRGRARPAIVAACLGAGVLAAGLLWPTSPGGPAVADGGAPAVSVSPGEGEVHGAHEAHEAHGEPTGVAGAPADAEAPEDAAAPPEGTDVAAVGRGSPADPVAVLGDLLDRRLACAGDLGCLSEVMENPDRSFGAGVVDSPARAITLVDEFGGVDVLRVDPVGDDAGPAQLVVIVRTDENWLLRDVYAVAEQPVTG